MNKTFQRGARMRTRVGSMHVACCLVSSGTPIYWYQWPGWGLAADVDSKIGHIFRGTSYLHLLEMRLLTFSWYYVKYKGTEKKDLDQKY